MKTFKDLLFQKHGNFEGKQALEFFENGYGVSMVRFKLFYGGYGSYTNNEKEWELAIITWDKDKFEICYTTEIANDVIGHLSARQVTTIMKKVQKLKKIN